MVDLFQLFSDPAFRPFTVAGAIVALIALLEVIGLVLGIGLFEVIDDLIPDPDTDGGVGVLAWLGVGEAPFMVVLVVLLAFFSIFGTGLQSLSVGVAGTTLPGVIAMIAALTCALPVSAWSARRLARLIPNVESSGVERDEFVGCIGEIVQGRASHDRAAEARVDDHNGYSHWLRVCAEPGETIGAGEPIRIVGRAESGVVFFARRRGSDAGDNATQQQ